MFSTGTAFFGLSTDTKPSAPQSTWAFTEVDTGKAYTVVGGVWTLNPAILISGTTVKTINGSSIVGSGDLVISGSAPAFTEFSQDLGVARRSGTFDLTVSGQATGKPVMAFQSSAAIASKGNARDEAEMDRIQIAGYVVSSTVIRFTWQAPAIVVGTYAFAYLVGA